MSMQRHFRSLARYNRWANARLYDAAALLTGAQFNENRGAFFGSMKGTLNHLLVTDRIWMNRFTGGGPTYDRLDLVLFEDLAALRAARGAEDERIVAFVEGIGDAGFDGVFRYTRVSSPEKFEQPLGPALAHFFNHQTHHRGQAHAILTGLTGRAPELDLLYYQREAGDGGRALPG
jgi:uncharacterized damage-inducible protein DinB